MHLGNQDVSSVASSMVGKLMNQVIQGDGFDNNAASVVAFFV
jgi:hypothetical protein